MKKLTSLLIVYILTIPIFAQVGFHGSQGPLRASRRGTPSTYAAITHREPIPLPALPDMSAGAGTTIIDPVFNTKVVRITDALTEPNNGSGGVNGKGTQLHTSSAADHNCWSLYGDKFYYLNSGGSTIVGKWDEKNAVHTPFAPTVNSPDYNGNTSGTPRTGSVGPRIINLQNEPDFSYEDNDKIYGSKVGVTTGHPTLAGYTFTTDVLNDVIDLSTLGYNLTASGSDYGGLLAYTSVSNADDGTYGTAHGELACALFGSANADYAYLVAIINVKNGQVVKLLNTRQNSIGTNSSNQVWKGFASASEIATTLNGSLDSSSTTITVLSTTYLPKDGAIKIDNEFITYTGTTSTTLTGCTRGANGSSVASHSTGANVLTYGYDLHGVTITRDGHYAYMTRANRTLPLPNLGNIWVWDIFNDSITFESQDDSGHVVAGFNLLANQNGAHDSMDWQIRAASDPNTVSSTNIYYATGGSSFERYNASIDGLTGAGNFNIADHTSWNNAKPGQRFAPILSGNYRYYSGGIDPYDYITGRPRAEWDDELFSIDPANPPRNIAYRFVNHRSKVRGDLKSAGTVTWSNGGTSVVGTGTSFLTNLSTGDPVNCTSWDGSSGATISIGQQRIVDTVTDDTHFTVTAAFTAAGTGQNLFIANKGAACCVFYYTPRASISQTGKYALFTSNWGCTLGAANHTDSSHGAFREDVFIVELPTTSPTTPTISNKAASSVSNTSETITFDTDVLGDTVVEYSTDSSYSNSSKDYLLKTTSHSVTLTGLSAGTLYNYRVKSRNRNVASGYTTGTFTTSGSAPADFVTDAFTESSDTTLASHTGSVGATWTKHPAAAYTSTATVDAATDRVYPLAITAYYASGVPPSADYYVQADFYAASIISVNAAIVGRMDTTADTMYLVRLNNGTVWELRKIVAGSATTLGSDSTAGNLPTVGNSKTVKLVMTGSTITVFVSGVSVISVTDTDITSAGKAGLRFSGTATSTTGFHIDNFSAR